MEKKAGEVVKTPVTLTQEEPHLYAIVDRVKHILCQSETDDAAKDVERKEIEELEYIVKCVNAHEALVKACKFAMEECCDLIATPAGNAIEAALALSEGK